jgi:chromosome segregation ATPase
LTSQERSSSSNPSSLSPEEVIAIKKAAIAQLRNYKKMLTEKIPLQRAEYERNMAELRQLFAEAQKKHDDELAAMGREIQALNDANTTTEKQLEFYRNAYEVCVAAPHRSFKCWVWKVVSFGTGKCH